MAATGERPEERRRAEPSVKIRLEEVIREALRTHVQATKLDATTNATLEALWSRFVVGIKRPRPRSNSERALAMRLPEVGVRFTMAPRKGKVWTLIVVSANTVELHCEGEQVTRHESLKAAARHILGYDGQGGWQFFFGAMSRDEVSARYGKQP